MATIPSSFAAGDEVTVAHLNSWGLALKAMGIADDDAGKLILPPSLWLPFAVRSGAGGIRTRAVPPSTTHTVGAGKVLYVNNLSGAGQFTANTGGGAFSITAASTGNAALIIVPTGLCLGAGDQLTTPAAGYAKGIEIDASALPLSPTRVLKTVTNAATHTVGAGKALLLTHAFPATEETTVAVLNIGGVNAFASFALSGTSGGTRLATPVWAPLWVEAGTAVAAAAAVTWVISGFEYSV
jgi:hypothetical protein